MKTLKIIAEIMWNLTSVVLSIAVLVAVLVLIGNHVTCVDFIKTWCVMH